MVLPLWESKLLASRGASPTKVSPWPGSGPWHRFLKFNFSRQLGTYSICILRKKVLHLGVMCVMNINVTAMHVNASHMTRVGLHWTEGYQLPGADISHTGAGRLPVSEADAARSHGPQPDQQCRPAEGEPYIRHTSSSIIIYQILRRFPFREVFYVFGG